MLLLKLKQVGKRIRVKAGTKVQRIYTLNIPCYNSSCFPQIVPKNHTCMLQVQVNPDTQKREGISEHLTAILLPHNIFHILMYPPTPPHELWTACTGNHLPEKRKLLWHKRLHFIWATNFLRACTAVNVVHV